MSEMKAEKVESLHPEGESAAAVDSIRGNAVPGVIIVGLARLPERALLDEQALASTLGVSKRTVRRMVGRYELPPPVQFAGRSMWQVLRIMSWFEDRADRLAREAQRVARKSAE